MATTRVAVAPMNGRFSRKRTMQGSVSYVVTVRLIRTEEDFYGSQLCERHSSAVS